MAGQPFVIDVNCRQIPGHWSGQLRVGNGLITASLFAFDRQEQVRPLGPGEDLCLVLETGQLAALVRCGQSCWGTRAYRGGRAIDHQLIRAQYLLAGAREWRETDRVSVFEFCLPQARGSLSFGNDDDDSSKPSHDALIRAVAWADDTPSELMRIEGTDYKVIFSRSPLVAAVRSEDVGEQSVWITIVYDDPQPLLKALQLPYHVQIFFELSEGKALRETGLAVRCAGGQRSDEGAEDHLDDFALYRTWHPAEFVEPEECGIENIFRIYAREDRVRTQNALTEWLRRRDAWAGTYWLASQFAHGGLLADRSRLLRAMAWFESIPDYQLDAGIRRHALDRFRREAQQLGAFGELGVSGERLGQVLNELKRIPLNERFRRAIADIRDRLGDIDPATLERDCGRAIAFRNSAAHGSSGTNEADFLEFVIATSAVETVALLCTIRELGVDPDRINAILNRYCPHPFATYQLWADARTARELGSADV
ncbi:hypothetical protein X759_28255 [Mesorhizobium sp. LSHC420B00]|uniref:hypothetical protein n=1 Tax=unclassified Mesorhizobium TaxID=325217 RepID=UPI0003CE0037|nr:hypothetical protein [Mesorhizobium sp. LSHC420B00]ESX66074.1 hypothetical protein X759_28255 [Mesorhizobium sp. LSHC420B00]